MKTITYGSYEMFHPYCNGKNPLECFYCGSFKDLIHTIASNKKAGIECEVIDLDGTQGKFDKARIAYNKGEITLEELVEKYNKVNLH